MVHPAESVAHAAALSTDSLVPDLFRDPSKISSIVSKVMSDLSAVKRKAVPSRRDNERVQEERELDEAMEFMESVSESPEPLTEMVLQMVMTTGVVEKFKKETASVKKGHDFFGYLIKQFDEFLDYKKNIEKLMKAGSLIEKVSGVKSGALDAAYTGAGLVFSKIEFAGDVLNVLSLAECAVTRCFQASVYFTAQRALKELKKQLSELSDDAKAARSVLKEKIDRLDGFVQIEKKTFRKELPTQIFSMAKQGIKVAKWALELAEGASAGAEPATEALSTAAGSLGVVVSGLGVCAAGVSLGKGIKKHLQYGKWLEVLQNEFKTDFPKFLKNAEENERIDSFVLKSSDCFQKRFRLEMPSDEVEAIQASIKESITVKFPEHAQTVISKICDQISQRCERQLVYQSALTTFEKEDSVQRPSLDLAKRKESLEELRGNISKFLKDQCQRNRVTNEAEFVRTSTHTLMRRLVYLIDCKVYTSPEKAAQSQLMTSSLKSGLTNLAIKKQQVQKRQHGFTLWLLSGKLFLAAAGLAVGILLVASCIAPPISSFIALGLIGGAFLLLGITAFRLYKTKPELFKATWGSLDGWLFPFRQLISKFRAFRMARLDLQKEQLERTLAPTCYKILLLERLKHKEFEEMKVDCSILGVSVGDTSDDTIRAIEHQIVLLKKTITDRDQLKLEAIQKDRDLVSKKLASIEVKISEMDKKLHAINLKSTLTLIKKDKAWQQANSLLADLKEGVADHLIDGVELCVPILDELKQNTGIEFNSTAIKKVTEEHKVSLAKARKKGTMARQQQNGAIVQEKGALVAFEEVQRKVGNPLEIRPQTRWHSKNIAEFEVRSQALEKASQDVVRAERIAGKAHQAKIEAYQPLMDALGAPIDSFLEKEEQDLNKLLSH